MKSFEYIQPKNLKEASQLLNGGWKEALPYAGGTDLYGLLKHDIMPPEKIINLKTIQGLDQISFDAKKGLRIGALVSVEQVAEDKLIAEKFTVLAQAAREVASPQLRNMGTLGGNICQRPRCWYFRGEFDCLRKGGDICYAVDGENKYHCIVGGGPCFIVHPSDTAVALLALAGEVTVFVGKKSREIPMDKFFVLPEKDVMRENILKPGEIVTEIRVPPLPDGTRSAYLKVKERGAWDFAMVSVAAVLKISSNMISNGTIAYGGVAPVPWKDSSINRQLNNLTITNQSLQKLAKQAFADAVPLEQNAYKVLMARNLTQRIFEQLALP